MLCYANFNVLAYTQGFLTLWKVKKAFEVGDLKI